MTTTKNPRLTLTRESVRVLHVSSGVLAGKPPRAPDSAKECYSALSKCVTYVKGCNSGPSYV